MTLTAPGTDRCDTCTTRRSRFLIASACVGALAAGAFTMTPSGSRHESSADRAPSATVEAVPAMQDRPSAHADGPAVRRAVNPGPDQPPALLDGPTFQRAVYRAISQPLALLDGRTLQHAIDTALAALD